MKRVIAGITLCLSFVLLLLAQNSRDSYRTAYAQWHQADPNLERDAGSSEKAFAQRVDKVAAAAATYGKERASFLRSAARRELGSLSDPFKPELEIRPDLRVFVTAETKTVETSIKTFENDKDRGIIQWRQALERERTALANLGTAVDDRQAAIAKAAGPLAAAETSRTEVMAEYAKFDAAIAQAANIVDKETAAWAEYYRKLSAAAATPVRVALPRPPAAAPVGPPVPLVRYTGTWSFPPKGVFSGARPEFVDLAVHEEDGQLKGSFYGRFTVVPQSKTDPLLRFDFSGPLGANRTQSLKLETSDGTKGTIDLIPGEAFNLLEVNFQTDPKSGKVQQGNMVLLKK